MQKRTKLIATGVAVLTVIGGGATASIAATDGEGQLSRSRAENVALPAQEHTGEAEVTETGTGDSGAAYRLDDGTQVDVNLDADNEAGDANETDIAITGPDLERASQVALDHLGEGRVTGTEVGDEDSYYEIEVTLDDGSQVDVQLDEGFKVVGADPDSRTDD